MVKVYPAIVHNEEDQFWVEFPDLPGCQSCAGTLEETISCAADALGLYLYSKIEDGAALPNPSDIKTIDPEDGFTTLIYSDPTRYERRTRAVKKTLTIPEWLNEEAEKRHINFSSVLKEALEQRIQK